MRRIAYDIDAGEEYCEGCKRNEARDLRIDFCTLFNERLTIEGIDVKDDVPLKTRRCRECLERDMGEM